jgi:hypothetical protein
MLEFRLFEALKLSSYTIGKFEVVGPNGYSFGVNGGQAAVLE